MMIIESPGSTTDTPQKALGAFIRERRLALGITQTQLAERINWVQERISLIENGKYGMPSLPALGRLANALEIRLFQMLAAAGYDEDGISSTGDTAKNSAVSLHTLQRLLAIPAASMKESLYQASDLLSQVLSADKIDILMYEPESASLLALGNSNTPMGRRQHAIGMDRLPLANGGREAEVFQTGRPYHSGHAKEDSEMLLGVTQGLGVQSIIIEPLDVGGIRRGVLVAESSRQNLFTEEDLTFMSLLARWVGMVAERAELAEQIACEAAERARRTAAEELMTVLAHDLNNHLTPL